MEIYGVVRWIKGNPVIDGMDAYESMEEAIAACAAVRGAGYAVTLTRINLHKAETKSA